MYVFVTTDITDYGQLGFSCLHTRGNHLTFNMIVALVIFNACNTRFILPPYSLILKVETKMLLVVFHNYFVLHNGNFKEPIKMGNGPSKMENALIGGFLCEMYR